MFLFYYFLFFYLNYSFSSWIDPDTPLKYKEIISYNNKENNNNKENYNNNNNNYNNNKENNQENNYNKENKEINNNNKENNYNNNNYNNNKENNNYNNYNNNNQENNYNNNDNNNNNQKERYKLIMSDEFNENNRKFTDGYDPKWTSINKNDYTNDALQYYKDNLVYTKNGSLIIQTINEDITFNAYSSNDNKKKINNNKMEKITKNYQSGMLQGWNKFCFTGGIVEISAKLPGEAYIGGLWPAMWLLGNLARATYVSSSDNMWPWSYDVCSREHQRQQVISKCNKMNHYGFHRYQGRGAPEIDILEAMPGKEKLINTPVNRPYFSASLQVSPGITDERPELGQNPYKTSNSWYRKGLEYGLNSSVNIYFYGTVLKHDNDETKDYQTDAISANRDLLPTHFHDFHKYRIEWKTGPQGYIKWYLDSELVFGLTAETLKENNAIIPEEPMYLIFNTAMSKTWGFPQPCPIGCPCNCYDCRKEKCHCAIPPNMCRNFPAFFEIDYVRVYQTESDPSQVIGCSTPTHPTSRYIKGKSAFYMKEGDITPLKPIMNGEGNCKDSTDCGREGHCKSGKCLCSKNYTGPHCQAPVGFNDINYEEKDDIMTVFSNISPVYIPVTLQFLLFLLFMSFVFFIYFFKK